MRARSAPAASSSSGSSAGSAASPSRSASAAQLVRRLGLLVAHLLGADLGDGDRLAALAQPLLDLGLLGRARAQRRGDALARGAVGVQLGLEHLDARPHGRQRAASDADEPLGRRVQRAVAGERGVEPLDPRGALGALARRALGDAPLGRELARELRAAHRALALLGRLRRSSMSHAARRSSSWARDRSRSASRSARSAPSRVPSAARDGRAGLLDGLAAPRARRRPRARTRGRASSRRLRSASTRSGPPCGAWRSSRVAPNQARPARVTATPAKPGGSDSTSSTTHALASSRRASATARSGPPTSSARHRAPGAGGAPGGSAPGAPSPATSARPPSGPARSSSARPAGTSSTTAAPSRPPSAAASASS